MRKKTQLAVGLAILSALGWYYTRHKGSLPPLAGKFAEASAVRPTEPAADPRGEFVNRVAALQDGSRILFSTPDMTPEYVSYFGWLGDDADAGGSCGVIYRNPEAVELMVLPDYRLPPAAVRRVMERPATVEGERCGWMDDGSWQAPTLGLHATMPLSRFTPKHAFDVLKGMRAEVGRRVKEVQP